MTQVIILNWNNGPDTMLCVESILGLPDLRIALLDNNSSDDSVAYMQSWLQQRGLPCPLMPLAAENMLPEAPLALYTSNRNLGFAPGINEVMRGLLHQKDLDYIWLLNNDAIAAPGALDALIQTLESDPALAFAGSVVLDYYDRGLVQCAGVRYFKYFGVAKLLFKDRRWDSVREAELKAAPIDFQNGASLLVRRSALEIIGLMDDRFFLYSEEHDWQYRAQKMGFGHRLSAASLVYHKGSMSTKSSKFLFFYYYSKSSVLFSRKHHSLLTSLSASVLLLGITLIRTKMNFKSLRWALKGMAEGWLNRL